MNVLGIRSSAVSNKVSVLGKPCWLLAADRYGMIKEEFRAPGDGRLGDTTFPESGLVSEVTYLERGENAG